MPCGYPIGRVAARYRRPSPLTLREFWVRVLLAFHYRDEPGMPRNYPQSPRYEMWNHILPIVEEQLPWTDIAIFDSGHTPYSRAASRNVAAEHALNGGYDVVVIHDADSYAEPEVLTNAVVCAYVDDRINIPFDTVDVFLPKWYQRNRARERWRPMYSYGPSFGGIYVCRPEVWFQAKGQDERVTGWGFEDEIFLVNTWSYVGAPVYHPGRLTTFYHERGPCPDSKDRNLNIRNAFNDAIHDRERLEQLNERSYDFGADAITAVTG